MNPRPFFAFAVITAILAIMLQLYSTSQFRRGGYYAEIYPNIALSKAVRDNARFEYVHSVTRGQTAVCSGLVFAFFSVVLLTISFRKKEPAHRSIAFGLLFCYLLVLFIR